MALVSPGVSQVSLRCLLVSFSVIGASSFPTGDSFGKVTDTAQYAPDLPRLHRILLIPNIHFFTFFPDVGSSIDSVSDWGHWIAQTTTRGVIWSNSRHREGWLDPSPLGVWVCEIVISVNSQVQTYFGYKVILWGHYYLFMLDLQQINSGAEY